MIILALFFPSTADAVVVPESCYTFSTGTIVGYNEGNVGCAETNLDIPSTIGGVAVTSIGSAAFRNKQLTAVTLPNSVVSIGDSAFRDNLLTSIDLPDSLTTLGLFAFQSNQLTSVVIPDSLTGIGPGVFSDNELTSVTLHEGMTNIGFASFAGNNLSTITLPESITFIAGVAFENNQLTSISIPDSVAYLGDSAFAHNQLQSVSLPPSLTTISESTFKSNYLTSVTIPVSVTEIRYDAFASNKLTDVDIPDSVTSIDPSSFLGQSSLGGQWESAVYSGDPAASANALADTWYARLYTATDTNPSGLTDSFLTEEDVWGGDLDGDDLATTSLGGHIINPTRATLNYVTAGGTPVASQTTATGESLQSYNVTENTTNDMSKYYRLGTTYSFTAPSVNGYVTPPPASILLAVRNTLYDFIYQPVVAGNSNSQVDTVAANAASDNSPPTLASTGQNLAPQIVVGMILLLISSLLWQKNKAQIRYT